MNTRQLLAAVTAGIAFIGTAAVAQEATNFDIPPSTLTRAEVRAELRNAPVEIGEARYTVQPATGTVDRGEVRAQADDARPVNIQHYLGE